ncbi:LacI family DNA-binding transcriptional regulator [Ruegeria sp. Ofav3-42]|uniref:LacI family DNA-binding transcriptional regulator n=1 Tax=Ruegeria sp. Ofav3-42 TaxID=2917759 RepID=UPI001EF59DFE|nr:LacI family DNA-binding transcriptional regulator [Ruegeria sp. Ofav3-42]
MSDERKRTAQRPRRVTAQTVAEAAGVSRSAVSRAFTPGAYLDAGKRKKIHEIAASMGYQPNALAAGLKDGRSHLVAVFVGNMRSAYDTEFVMVLVGRLNALNKWPILIDGGDGSTKQAIQQVLRYPLDALILRGGSMQNELVTQSSKIGIPMISSGRIVEAKGVDNVCCRNAKGTRLAAEVLVDAGRRRFGYIGGPEQFSSSADRRQGVVDVLTHAGLPLIAEATGEFTVEAGFRAATTLLQENTLDALVCANDATAIGALTAARELGVAVPGALSIVGFDDIDMARWPTFDLSTVCNPIYETVERVIWLLERRLANPAKPSETILIDPYFVPRGTH